jgi:hypothetical protein
MGSLPQIGVMKIDIPPAAPRIDPRQHGARRVL